MLNKYWFFFPFSSPSHRIEIRDPILHTVQGSLLHLPALVIQLLSGHFQMWEAHVLWESIALWPALTGRQSCWAETHLPEIMCYCPPESQRLNLASDFETFDSGHPIGLSA